MTSGHDVAARLAAAGHRELADRVEVGRPVGALTTYRVGGAAEAFVVVERPTELVAIGAALGARQVPVIVLGRGSNVLVGDSGVAGLVVHLGEGFAEVLDPTDVESGGVLDGPHVEITAGGATLLPVLARRCVAAGLTGFEWAVGVPGSIGGAVRMNAGGHGSDMAASLVRVRVVDLAGGEDGTVEAADLALDYRQSNLRSSQVVVSATLALARGDRSRGEAELADIVRWRRAHQPGGQNAGSVFRNPGGAHGSAGALIDRAGCRGLRIGSAEVSTKHANFIQVDPGGRADDVLAVMATVRDRVHAVHGVWLTAETHVFGVDRARCDAAGARWRGGVGA